MRGTLTNGYEWLFIVVSFNPGGRGASYMTSIRSYSAAPQEIGGDTVVHGDQADMIAGILASWVSCQLPGMSFGVLTLLYPT